MTMFLWVWTICRMDPGAWTVLCLKPGLWTYAFQNEQSPTISSLSEKGGLGQESVVVPNKRKRRMLCCPITDIYYLSSVIPSTTVFSFRRPTCFGWNLCMGVCWNPVRRLTLFFIPLTHTTPYNLISNTVCVVVVVHIRKNHYTYFHNHLLLIVCRALWWVGGWYAVVFTFLLLSLSPSSTMCNRSILWYIYCLLFCWWYIQLSLPPTNESWIWLIQI